MTNYFKVNYSLSKIKFNKEGEIDRKLLIFVLLCFFILSSFLSLNAQCGWARTYGGSGVDEPWSIQQTSDGGYIIVGITGSVLEYDICVLKVDSNGSIEWQKKYGGNSGDDAYSIQQTSDGGYIIGGWTFSFGAGGRDIWILKLSSTGDIEWQRTYGGTQNDTPCSIQQTSDGGYIIGGFTHSFDAGTCHIWVLKLSSTGDIEWQHTYGHGGPDVDSAQSIQQTSDGGYIIGGSTGPTQYEDFWVLKVDSTGNIEWQKTYGGSKTDWGKSIQQTSDGGYIIAGDTFSFGAGSSDVWVLKLSSTGVIEWQRTYGGTESDSASSIQQTSDGGYIVAGSTASFGAGSSDVWVLKLSSTGAIEWQRTYGGTEGDGARSIQQTSDGGYIVAGITYSFGAGDCDFWVLKLCSDGDIDASCGFIGSSNATITDTHISPVDSSITPQDTNITALNTSVSPQDTSASVNLLCEGPKYTLVISSTPRGTTVPAPGSCIYYKGSEVKIEAIPDAGFNFLYWSGNVPSGHEKENPITITMNSDKSIKANFQYTLTIAAGTGGTTNPAPGSYTYDVGTNASVTATPDSGYRFSSWTGNVPSGHEKDNPITIIMDSDRSLKANFIRQYTLNVATTVGGTTNPSPGTYIHDSGTQVSITATPNSGYQFSGWSGSASGTTNPITITMDNDKSITASFTATPPPPPKKGCFIATAAYGSPLHPYVNILRDFRDEYLMPIKIGRALVGLYYKYSPFVADIIAKNKVLKVAVRISLLPMIAFSYSMVHFGPIITVVILVFVFAFPMSLISFFLKKLRRVEAGPKPWPPECEIDGRAGYAPH